MALQRVVGMTLHRVVGMALRRDVRKAPQIVFILFFAAVVTMAALSSLSPHPLLTSSQTTYVIITSRIRFTMVISAIYSQRHHNHYSFHQVPTS